MSYRDILVQMNGAPHGRVRAAAAAGLAKRFNGHLTGVFVESDLFTDAAMAEVLAYMPPHEIETLFSDHAKAVAEAGEAARMLFEAAAGEAGVTSDWRTIPHADNLALVDLARRADLTVFPPTAEVSFSARRIPAGDIALDCGGPLLVVPEQGCDPSVGQRILLAWNGSRESARALRDAWPLIMTAEEVHVLVVAPEGEGWADGLLQRHLERHGLAANLIVDRSADTAASDIIRHQITALGVDLLVMGLFGHSRLREVVFGGVSRELLAAPPIATLISH